jgi:50S ribosomal subunit-associated GTPase HflX
MFRFHRSLLLAFLGLAIHAGVEAKPVDPPCDKYPSAQQPRCAEIWKELNLEDGPIISQFGLDQLKRREEGKISAQQHLAENMTFIKQSTEKRLERLKERMAKEAP